MERILKADVSVGKPIPGGQATNSVAVDYNSWIESGKALQLASTLEKDDIIVEGLHPRRGIEFTGLTS